MTHATAWVNIRTATPADYAVISALLVAEELPTEGVAEHLDDFLVAEEDGTIVGAVGLERYDDTALLRSAVVIPLRKGRGIGGRLVEGIEKRAGKVGVRRLVLLTTTAGEYFLRKGYRSIERSTVKGPITRSAEFTGACPATALCLEKML